MYFSRICVLYCDSILIEIYFECVVGKSDIEFQDIVDSKRKVNAIKDKYF